MAKEDEQSLENLKKDYEKFRKKYDLPRFEEMNREFHVEKVADQETEMLHWEIKRLLGDKLSNYMRFIENLLNPVNVPIFIFSIVKVLTDSEKRMLSEIYKKLMKNELMFIQSDLCASEEKDAEFIKNSFSLWQDIKENLEKILGKVGGKWENSKIEPVKKDYFG